MIISVVTNFFKNVSKKIAGLFSVILLFTGSVQAQIVIREFNADSLLTILENSSPDTTRVDILLMLAESYFFKSPPISLKYSTEALQLARKLNFKIGIGNSLIRSGESLRQIGEYPAALKAQFDALEIYKELKNKRLEAASYGFIGRTYFDIGEHAEAIPYLRRWIEMDKGPEQGEEDALFTAFLGTSYSFLNKPDSAFFFINQAKNRAKSPPQVSLVTLFTGMIFQILDNRDSAFYYYKKDLSYAQAHQIYVHVCGASERIAVLFDQMNQIDSSIYYANKAFRLATITNLRPKIRELSDLLSKNLKKKGELDSSLYYAHLVNAMTDSIYGKEKSNDLQLLALREQRRGQEIRQEEERHKNRMIVLGLSAFAIVLTFGGAILFRSNRLTRKSNIALEKSLTDLKSTQAQLVQSEKMASLGELTAGIAHEIQNPLNFVNNFSEINTELIEELKAESIKPKTAWDESLIKETLDNISDNEQKIVHHGKRADAIVKSMLQHSRTSSGKKEPTDLNALCDEYLRLAYYGLRAKDKSFNAKFETNLNPTLPKINVVPQDIGRVILNLINNAFYAVSEKQKSESAKPGSSFEPTVIVSTHFSLSVGEGRGEALITVKDNGPGIPDSIKEKIFQPFFTTKPTGQGTGLGLSLSYDIVKAHGGELSVETKVGEGTEFIIYLTSL
jgi:signal transduction histidine kinase